MSVPVQTKISELIQLAENNRVKIELFAIHAMITDLTKKSCEYCCAPGCVRKHCHPYHTLKAKCKGDKVRSETRVAISVK